MSAIDIRRLFRVAWERTKASQGIKEDDPVIENVQGSVIRSIAELEVARLQRTNPVPLGDQAPPLPQEHGDDHHMPKVA